MIDRKIFFDTVRESLFGGSLTEQQVAGMEATLDVWTLYSLGLGKAGELRNNGEADPRHLAYILATTFHEVGARMVPVREGFKRFDRDARAVVAGREYGKEDQTSGEVYYGRGTTQVTWAENAITMGDLFGVDLYAAPDIMLGHHASQLIQFAGMLRGMFTGKKLSDYIHDDICDYYNARRIVNALDHAADIANYAEHFEAAIRAASE